MNGLFLSILIKQKMSSRKKTLCRLESENIIKCPYENLSCNWKQKQKA